MDGQEVVDRLNARAPHFYGTIMMLTSTVRPLRSGYRRRAFRSGGPSQSGVTIEAQIVVDRANGSRTFPNCGPASFGRSEPDTPTTEQPGMTGFERSRGRSNRFPPPVEA